MIYFIWIRLSKIIYRDIKPENIMVDEAVNYFYQIINS